jgi:hypothetical protein
MAFPFNTAHGGGYKPVAKEDFDRHDGSSGTGRPAINNFSIGGGGRGSSGLAALEMRRQEQNSDLSVLDRGVSRLGELSLGISKEIDLQNRMIDNLQEDTERVQTQADLLTKQTQELVKKSGGPKTFCLILVLLLVFLFLTFLVIYT